METTSGSVRKGQGDSPHTTGLTSATVLIQSGTTRRLGSDRALAQSLQGFTDGVGTQVTHPDQQYTITGEQPYTLLGYSFRGL